MWRKYHYPQRFKDRRHVHRICLQGARLLVKVRSIKFQEQQKVLCENTGRAMANAPKEVKLRHIGNCFKADPAYGEGVAKALGIPMSEVKE
ncbi:MAG: hypothetical protein GY799_04940 [Desulfobulbaceae bacterium]|nr:hypothetical protein [Desulfobulbaceae bacterium]